MLRGRRGACLGEEEICMDGALRVLRTGRVGVLLSFVYTSQPAIFPPLPTSREPRWQNSSTTTTPSGLASRPVLPAPTFNKYLGRVAQLVERSLSIPSGLRKVLGSIPSSSTSNQITRYRVHFFPLCPPSPDSSNFLWVCVGCQSGGAALLVGPSLSQTTRNEGRRRGVLPLPAADRGCRSCFACCRRAGNGSTSAGGA